jgi:hemerythrin
MTHADTKLIPQVTVEFMNNDHEEAVEILDTILAAIENSTVDEVTSRLEAFFAHNQIHFSREEEQMRRVNFPPYSCHKGEHDRVLFELAEAIEQWKERNDREYIAHYLNCTLWNWFINHIKTMDTVTAMFINQHAH